MHWTPRIRSIDSQITKQSKVLQHALTLGLLRNSFCASSDWYTHESCGLSLMSPTYAHVLFPLLHVFTCRPCF